jgi:hypothetical protein
MWQDSAKMLPALTDQGLRAIREVAREFPGMVDAIVNGMADTHASYLERIGPGVFKLMNQVEVSALCNGVTVLRGWFVKNQRT